MKFNRLINKLLFEFCFWMGFTFWTFCKTSQLAVSAIFNGCSLVKMEGINAKLVIAMMQNPFSFLNWSNVDYPRSSMGIDCDTSLSSAYSPVSISDTGFPDPTLAQVRAMIWDGAISINLCVKSFWKVCGKTLRSQVNSISIRLHNQLFWLCHALGCSFTARAFSL